MGEGRIRIGLIGCGRIVARHLDVLGALEQFELVSVCDLDAERARRAAATCGVRAYTDYLEMLEREHLDAATVLTESGSHVDVAVAAASHVRTLIIEKPMALTLESADRLIEVCERNRTRLFVVKQNRYNPPVLRLREALEAGRFGKLVLGTVRVRWCRRQDYYDQDSWRGTWKQDGGVFANQASHHVDLLQWGDDQQLQVELGETVRVVTKTIGDATVEIWDANRRAGLFQKAFGKAIEIV